MILLTKNFRVSKIGKALESCLYQNFYVRCYCRRSCLGLFRDLYSEWFTFDQKSGMLAFVTRNAFRFISVCLLQISVLNKKR